MKFHKLSVGTFGKLEDREFSFSEGLNIIYGKNEAGKSTLAACMKYILYGFSSQRSRTLDNNDKLKYIPWKNDSVHGSATVSSGGKIYRIDRSGGAKNVLKIRDGNGIECNFGKEPGEVFLGADENAYVKMAYIRQNDITENTSDGLSDIVQNIVYSADETVDIEKARKKLSGYRNAYRTKTGKGGRCSELEEKIASLRHDFNTASDMHKSLLSAEAKLSETRNRIKANADSAEKLREELANIDGYEAAAVIEKVLGAKKALDSAQSELEQAKSSAAFGGRFWDEAAAERLESVYAECLRCENELDDAEEAYEAAKKQNDSTEPEIDLSRFPDRKPPDLSAVGAETESVASSARTFSVIAACIFVAAVLAAVVGYLKLIPSASVAAISAAAALGAVSILMFAAAGMKFAKVAKIFRAAGFAGEAEFRDFEKKYPEAMRRSFDSDAREKMLADDVEQKRKNAELCRERLISVLALFGKSGIGDAEQVISDLKNALSRLRSAENEYRRCESVYDAYLSTNDMHALSDAANKYTHVPERDRKTVLRDLDFLEKANAQLLIREKEYIKQASYPASSVRKPSEILAEKEATEAQLKEACEKADALDMALEALENACAELKGGISPRIAARAGELFRLFTDEKYPTLELSSEFDIGVTGAGCLREGGYLSKGTLDAAYLALRIALCETLFREKPVIILDEAFAYIDDARLAAILAVLTKLASEYQIFIFTCHEREKNMSAKNANINVIEL